MNKEINVNTFMEINTGNRNTDNHRNSDLRHKNIALISYSFGILKFRNKVCLQ